MNITVSYRKKEIVINTDTDTSVVSLIAQVSENIHLNPNRIRLYEKSNDEKLYLKESDLLKDRFSSKVATLHVKDLGPQVGYRTVFIVEYAGPLAIWMIIAAIVGISSLTSRQLIASCMWIFHFTKRILESIFVHKFSHPTMPVRNIFKNSIYYWTFGILVSLNVLVGGPWMDMAPGVITAGTAMFVVFELLNLYTHIRLRTLRPAGSKAYVLPTGFLFNRICCPNYTMEIAAWCAFNLATMTVAGWLFIVVGTAQIYQWAVSKKNRLVAKFPEARKRGLLLPRF
eukprot:gnl/Dysnectes_brevis/1165_a1299_3833.p1 GENE.gnl/Dysnectes_brevis/1165_a1299_3833~~gnl/Dysnectes_brevis/1165_a1299_3833.p1  ORF type:complete len:285 (+),score=47.75 gnl/Dysnectes_brevis/1165_a1299_3833:26-880(+)